MEDGELVGSLQNSTRLVTNLESAVHVGPQGVNMFHTLFSDTVLNEITRDDVWPSDGFLYKKKE